MRDLPTNDGLLPILWWYNDDIMGIYIYRLITIYEDYLWENADITITFQGWI